MKTITLFQRVALIAVLVLPALVYIIFVYGQNEVFFQTLDYVGEKVYDEDKQDTLIMKSLILNCFLLRIEW